MSSPPGFVAESDHPVSVTRAWIAGRDAVLAVARFCLDQSWIFVEVPGQSDFGKDGYVDIVTDDGAVSGSCFAVQIKGGRSYRRTGGYRIDATEANRRQWVASRLPVIGIVWDPEAGHLFWANLTAMLNDRGVEADLLVPRTQHLNGASEVRRFKKYIGSVAYRQASVLDLASSDVDLQMAGVASSYHIGRTDGRALILLRRMLFSLERDARRSGVWALASAVPHPDILGTADGSPDRGAAEQLKPALRWSVSEIVEMLEMIDDENGMGRGSFGQHVYQLLAMDPSHAIKAEKAAVQAAQHGASEAAGWALVLAVCWADDDGASEYHRLLEQEPMLTRTWAAAQIEAALAEFGRVSLF